MKHFGVGHSAPYILGPPVQPEYGLKLEFVLKWRAVYVDIRVWSSMPSRSRKIEGSLI